MTDNDENLILWSHNGHWNVWNSRIEKRAASKTLNPGWLREACWEVFLCFDINFPLLVPCFLYLKKKKKRGMLNSIVDSSYVQFLPMHGEKCQCWNMIPLQTPDSSSQKYLFSEIFSIVSVFALNYRVQFLVSFGVCVISGALPEIFLSFKSYLYGESCFHWLCLCMSFSPPLCSTSIIFITSSRTALPAFPAWQVFLSSVSCNKDTNSSWFVSNLMLFLLLK